MRPLFHFGILLIALGHVGGLLVPESWTEAVGIDETTYHAVAVSLGVLAGVCALAGAAILIYRRRTVGPVLSATTRNDKVMYVLLVGTIVLGLGTTVLGNLTDDPHNYRESVSPCFRSIFYFQLQPELMTKAPLGFQPHALAAWVLFAFWPFSRLVHVFSMPLGYLNRPISSTAVGTHNWAAERPGADGSARDDRSPRGHGDPSHSRRTAPASPRAPLPPCREDPGDRHLAASHLIALTEGAELAEHDAPTAATLQVLTGRVRLHTNSQEWTLDSGQLATIPTQRHGLDAITAAAVLLTVALR